MSNSQEMTGSPEILNAPDNDKTPEGFVRLMDEYLSTMDADKKNGVSRTELQQFLQIPSLNEEIKSAATLVEQNFKFFNNLDNDAGVTHKDLAKFASLTSDDFYKNLAIKNSKQTNGTARIVTAVVGAGVAGVAFSPAAAPLGAMAGLAVADLFTYNNRTFDTWSDIKDRNTIEKLNYFDFKK
jgi:hypothetical protein